MKRIKQIKRIILLFFGMTALLAAGAFAGVRYEQYRQAEREQQQEKVDVIAVVNMDEGIVQGDGQINYASQLIQMPGDNYVTAGLNEAKAGINNGTYAAYIVIPENFSESVASVESNPQKILLEYAFNQKLDSETKEQVLNDVDAFETTLNTNIAYMYIDAIMTAFHDVQDDASAILKSDAAELTQLENVNAAELIISMEQPTLEQVENTVEPVNLEPYLSENTTLLDHMLQEFDDSVRLGMEEFAAVQTEHQNVTQATEAFFATYGIVLADTAVKNSEIAADGRLNLENAIALFNEDVNEDVCEVETQLAALIEIQRAADENAANTQHEAVVTQLCEEYDEELDTLQKEWENAYAVWCSYTEQTFAQKGEELRGNWQEELDAGLADLLELAYAKGAADALDAVEQNVAALSAAGDDGSGGDDGGTESGGDDGSSGDGGSGDESGSETGGAQETVEASYTAAQIQAFCNDIRMNIDAKAGEYLAEQGENAGITLSGDVLENFSINLAEAVDASGNAVVLPAPGGKELQTDNADAAGSGADTEEDPDGGGTDTADETDSSEETPARDIVLGIAEASDAQAVSETAAGFAELFALNEDRQAISDLIQQDFVEKLTTEGEKQMLRLVDPERDMSTAMEDYELSLLTYDPFRYLEANSMTAYLSDIGTNASDMLMDVEENNLEYTKYASDVYIKATEDVVLLQEAYRDAGEQTAGNVESCIETLQASRSEANGQNTDMLESFSVLLPYTRVGSQANPEVYEHIVNPVVSAENGSRNITSNVAEESGQLAVSDIITMLLLVGIFVCVFVIISSAAHRSRESRKAEETV